MTGAQGKKPAALSLDLDNQWSYMKTGSIAGWRDYPSYFDIAVPRILDVLSANQANITFFIVGRDAADKQNHDALQSIASAGHEIANHSFEHEPWLNRRSKAEIRDELDRAHDAIAQATGKAPKGFRGPGFSLSTRLLNVLADMDYAYDASTFPTFLGPLARTYYFFTSGFSAEEKRERAHLFGTLADGLRSLHPYQWDLGGRTLTEMPVSTIPLVRAPFHLSYLSFLATYSPFVALTYFRTAITACKIAGVAPSLLLHPLDFMGHDDVDVLGKFPGMGMKAKDKLELVSEVVKIYCDTFNVMPMIEHAQLAEQSPLKQRVPQFDVDAAQSLSPSQIERLT